MVSLTNAVFLWLDIVAQFSKPSTRNTFASQSPSHPVGTNWLWSTTSSRNVTLGYSWIESWSRKGIDGTRNIESRCFREPNGWKSMQNKQLCYRLILQIG